MEINQFHSGTAVGDAITNQMILIKDILEKNGYKSNIYAEHIPDALKGIIKNVKEYKGKMDNLLIIHHSMGFDYFDNIVSLPDKKILIYHNITPEKFFEDEGTKRYIRKGLKQLSDYSEYVDYAIADSNYNRKQMIEAGFTSTIDVMPVNISLDRFEAIDADNNVIDGKGDNVDILFVGRIVWNKRQLDIIKTFYVYNKYFNNNSRLHLVGDDSIQPYVQELKRLINEYGIADKVEITGKVDEAKLKAYYEIADVFLCMSEHEGFGVPLLEAMKMRVPVIACDSSALAETMGKAGVLFEKRSFAYIAALIDEIIINKDFKNGILQAQDKRIQAEENLNTEEILINAINQALNGNRKKTVQMQGPFETSYSLAIVNRKLIEVLDKDIDEIDASIYCTEGPGDYEPRESDMADKPRARALWEKGKNVVYPDVTIRNMYPPRVKDVNGGLNFQSFGWEESYIPEEYIKDFNKYLDGVGTMSEYVTDILIQNGLTIPVKTMGIGVELPKNYDKIKPFPLKTKKKTVFLNISSAFPRKGIDILLKAYFEEFTGDEDVCLVLKTFPNPHNNVEDILNDLKLKYNNPPEVEWINMDLSEEKLYGLYKSASCYVHTARGEGFGLPVAEAMLAKVPVIVSANSGMADFCNGETALLVSFKPEEAKTHINSTGNNESIWFEPCREDLMNKLRFFYDEKDINNRIQRVDNAYQLIREKFSWTAVANRWKCFIDEVEYNKKKINVSMVTTWNTKCGIAEFSRMEVNATSERINYTIYPNNAGPLIRKDEEFVSERLWINRDDVNLDALVKRLLEDASEIVNFQFNMGFFSLNNLGKAIDRLVEEKKVIVSFHSVKDLKEGLRTTSLSSIADKLNKCYALVVHQEEDKEVLVSKGIDENIIKIIPLGQMRVIDVPCDIARRKKNINSSFVVGSYGFLLPHKGIKEVIESVAIIKKDIPDILYIAVCSLYDCEESKEYKKECEKTIQELELQDNVMLVTDYLEDEESLKYLHCCDMLVMAYKNTQESASGAMRFCMAAMRPVITTGLPIFNEFKECSDRIKSPSPSEISEAVLKLKNDTKRMEELIELDKDYIKEHSWEMVAKKVYELIQL